MRIYRIPHSTNVERVALALAHKSMAVDWIDVDPDDRSPVVELSGQDLVPVLQADHGEVVTDSMRIVAWLEKRRPDPPLWPAGAGRRAEVDVFIEWFNRVWKVPPNAMTAELAAEAPDARRLEAWDAELRGWLHLFEAMLDGRDWLMTETFGAADLCAFPFLKYGVLPLGDDDHDPFHRVLADHLPIKGAFPAIEAWVHRVDALPRA
jgi:glutathione S-transferase